MLHKSDRIIIMNATGNIVLCWFMQEIRNSKTIYPVNRVTHLVLGIPKTA